MAVKPDHKFTPHPPRSRTTRVSFNNQFMIDVLPLRAVVKKI